MNAPTAILAAANVFAAQMEETSEAARTRSPWFWVVLLVIAVLALAWYFRAGTISRRP
ncbi:hypothetical protein [Polyangium jinanense]|uniref:Uncharacterized protein n=1 Tax=Polyangium jinanense TaxID=2829994 RepID=A0A9X3X925_9BACT|nr:hypothetical protein [Polyangium jinanense]MDC3960320.1 hypothetical protein [Polyangium jinanense]MDC3986427.1 hypothetical protein [Polyangium jinanense]